MAVTVDDVANTIHFDANFSDLLAPTAAAHIHCCTPPGANQPVAVGPGTLQDFPLGVTSGSYDPRSICSMQGPTPLASSPISAAALSTACAMDHSAAIAGETYFNIHSDLFRGGEIRGQLSVCPNPCRWHCSALHWPASPQFAAARSSQPIPERTAHYELTPVLDRTATQTSSEVIAVRCA